MANNKEIVKKYRIAKSPSLKILDIKMSNTRWSNLLFLSALGILSGQMVPLAFITIDMLQLGLPFTLKNLFEIYTSQLIYYFSSICFPIFIFAILLQLKRITSQKIFLNTILNVMTEQIIVFDSFLKPRFKNLASINSFIQTDLDDLLKQKERTDSFEWSCGEAGSLNTFSCCFKQLNDPSGMLLIMKDISDFKRKDEIIKTQEQKMINSSRLASLGEMAAGLAHEINNPLAVIIGRTEITMSQISNGSVTNIDISKTMSKIQDMSFRIAKIVTSMRKISKANIPEEVTETSLIIVIEDILNISSEKLHNSSVNVDYSQINKTLLVEASFSQLSQVIINLINNSMDELLKLPQGKRNIWISTEEVEGQAILNIRDSGAGIPMVVREKMFQPFYTTKEIGKGTGLGLSISKALMVEMGGDLELSSELSQTCFILKFKKTKGVLKL